jgi:hydrogenase maturation factor HypF (carbamoyltransferase family)
VVQNRLLLGLLVEALRALAIEPWTNATTPPNDGGVSLGQVALAALGAC